MREAQVASARRVVRVILVHVRGLDVLADDVDGVRVEHVGREGFEVVGVRERNAAFRGSFYFLDFEGVALKVDLVLALSFGQALLVERPDWARRVGVAHGNDVRWGGLRVEADWLWAYP